jgi:glycosyltransferase involved in cell wall biosynthesis
LGKVRRKHQGTRDRFPEDRIEIEEQIVDQSDRLIAECPQDEQDLIQLYGADSSRIRTIGCGFDRDEFGPVDKQDARRRLGLPIHQRIVLQLGRMVPRKGVDDVIRGFAEYRHRTGACATLVVVGGESNDPAAPAQELDRLARIAHETGIREHVVFTGQKPREELRFYYSAADVFVTTPWYEPFGITPLEAMACGTPVIGSAVGGILFTVRDGETGFHVPPRDPHAIADRLHRMLSDDALRTRLGENARRDVNSRFTWPSTVEALADVYEELIVSRRPSTSEPRFSGELQEVGT